MIRPPQLSIVIAAYNMAAFLPRCLESISEQALPPGEIVIVNDGSTDNTTEVLERTQGLDLQVISQANSGVSEARNVGTRAASGEFVLFLDPDDTLVPSALESLTERLGDSDVVDVIHGDWQIVNDRSGRQITQQAALGPDPVETLLYRNPMALHSVLVRREAVLTVGGFRDREGALEDWELWLDLALSGARFAHVPEVIANYHWRPGSGSSHTDRLHAVRLDVLGERQTRFKNRIDAAVWRRAESNAWLDHAVNRLRADDASGACAALEVAAQGRPGLLADIGTHYRLWRSDYLEALGDRSVEEEDARWLARRQLVSEVMELLAANQEKEMSVVRAANQVALSRAMREVGRPGAALLALGRVLRWRPTWIRRQPILRLAARSAMEGLKWTHDKS